MAKFQKKPTSTGFGESKPHIAPEGSFAPDNWDDYTIGGGPIPEHVRGVVTYAMTDQGKAEAERRIAENGGRAYTETVRDETDKTVDEYGDRLARPPVKDPRAALVLQSDPLQTLLRRHTPPGHQGRFMGKKKTDHAGLVRGVIEYEPVLIDDGKGGKKRVEQGGMFLASVPNEVAEAARQHYRELEESQRMSVADKVQEHNERTVGNLELNSIAKKRGKLADLVGETEDTQRGQREMDAALAQ